MVTIACKMFAATGGLALMLGGIIAAWTSPGVTTAGAVALTGVVFLAGAATTGVWLAERELD